jgi:hypothetical protein
MTAARQGKVRIQAVHSAARRRRHGAWAEPRGWPTLARTRTSTHRPTGAGTGQQLFGIVAEVGEDGLEVGLAEGS